MRWNYFSVKIQQERAFLNQVFILYIFRMFVVGRHLLCCVHHKYVIIFQIIIHIITTNLSNNIPSNSILFVAILECWGECSYCEITGGVMFNYVKQSYYLAILKYLKILTSEEPAFFSPNMIIIMTNWNKIIRIICNEKLNLTMDSDQSIIGADFQ